jgi:NitT/TauT family transport system permease protein
LEFGARGGDQGPRESGEKAEQLKEQRSDEASAQQARRIMQTVMQATFRYLPLLLMAIAWEAIARLNLVDSSALPPLSKVGLAWVDLMRGGELVNNGAASLYRGSVGLFLAVLGGGGLGLCMARWRLLDVFVNPLVELFYPLPKSALIPVTVLWLGFGDGSKILLIFLGCMIPVTIGAYNGARGSDHALVWSARSMGANRLRMMWDVVVPSALPELLNGIRTALALAFILLVSSELIVSQQGFGYLIGYLGSTGSYEGMYAVVLTVAFLGFAADRIYQLFIQWLLRWRD